MHTAAPSSSYYSCTLVATNATCSHEVVAQPQPTMLLSSSSSTITAAFRLRPLGYHLSIDINHLKIHSLIVESQPTLLLPSSSSTVATTFDCHPSLRDFTTAASTLLSFVAFNLKIVATLFNWFI
ncbi:hypothetical protein BHM03_00022123 [Ensete ventricosum]|nr:hypothetical protein BHM03_00022123 [Ensete ventricosum]